MNRILTLTAATLVLAAPAFAEMDDYDGDADGMLNEAEFGEADGMKRWGDYDADGSGDISEEEFAAGEFRRYDSDRDGGISDTEYTSYEGDGEED